MNVELFFRDLELLCDNLGNPESVVRKWTDKECPDYKWAVSLVINVMDMAYAHGRGYAKSVKDTPYYVVAIDIIRNSHLGYLLEYDDARNALGYKSWVSQEIVDEIGRYLVKRIAVAP